MPLKKNFFLETIPPQKSQEMGELADEIEARIVNNEDASELIKEFNDHCWRPVEDSNYFRYYYQTMSRDEFIAERFIPLEGKRSDVTDDDLYELIKAIMDMKYPDNRHLSYWLEIVTNNLPCGSEINDLIFWSDLSIEEIFKRAQTPGFQTYKCEICKEDVVGTYKFFKHRQVHKNSEIQPK